MAKAVQIDDAELAELRALCEPPPTGLVELDDEPAATHERRVDQVEDRGDATETVATPDGGDDDTTVVTTPDGDGDGKEPKATGEPVVPPEGGKPADTGATPATGAAAGSSPTPVIDAKAEERRVEALKRLNDTRKWVVITAWVLFAIFALWAVVASSGWHPSDHPSLFAAAGTFAFLALALHFFNGIGGPTEGGFLRMLVGRDGRVSTSYTQAALWTLLLAGAFVFFLILSVASTDATTDLDETLQTLDSSYLLLLGGPFAATVATGLITQSKVNQETLQKTETEAAAIRDILTDDEGRGDLIDGQFFIFNLVAMVWFVVSIIDKPGALPHLPDALVGLTSLSALTYTATKAAASNAPAIRSITRRADAPGSDQAATAAAGVGIRPGDLVDIRGINFLPPGSDTGDKLAQLRIKFDTITVAPEIDPAATTSTSTKKGKMSFPTAELVVARVPTAGLNLTAPVPVVVVTPAGVESEPSLLSIDADVPSITSIDPSVPAVDQNVIVRGRYFRRPGEPAMKATLPTFLFGDVAIRANGWMHGDGVRVKVPKALAAGASTTVKAKQHDGVTESAAVPLTLKA